MERLSVVWSHFLYTKQLPGTNVVVDYTATPNPPAPGRRLLIIRTDPSIDPSTGALLSFDDSGQHSVSSSRSRRNSWMEKAAESWRPDSPESSDSGDADDTTTRRWSLLRNVMGVTGTSRAKSQSPRPSARDGTDGGRSSPPVRTDRNDQPASSAENFVRRHSRQRSGSMPAAPRHRTFCFKFSLEYVDRRFQNPASVELRPPHLPFPAQQHLLSQYNLTAMFDDIRPTRPDGAAASYVTYTGRALAEWSGVVNECQNFFERRMREGVPSNKLVETPILGVETFKRPG